MSGSQRKHAAETQSNVADFVVQRLQSWGVERVFGYAGDGFNGILGALRRSGNRPRFIQAAHEELSALMACAVTGSAGWLGTATSNRMFRECDTLFNVGSGFPYTEFLPREGEARGVQIDIDARMLSLRYPMEVALAGDSRATLRALAPLLRRKVDRSWLDRIEAWNADWQRRAADQAMRDGDSLDPRRVLAELSPRLPDGVVLAGDCGSSTVWYARYLNVRRGMLASLSGMLATMGSAVPYATAAKFARPDRPVVAIAGDGAMQMSGINALITVAKSGANGATRVSSCWCSTTGISTTSPGSSACWKASPSFPLRRTSTTSLRALCRAARFRERAHGARGRRRTRLGQALRADRPVVVEAVGDPHVPPLPPRLRPEQQEKIRRALQEDPDAERVWQALERDGLMARGS